VLRTAGRATAVGAYHQHKADRHTLATVSPNVPIGIVHASRSKQAPPKSLIGVLMRVHERNIAPNRRFDKRIAYPPVTSYSQ
jgi:hypothetical protein